MDRRAYIPQIASIAATSASVLRVRQAGRMTFAMT